MDGNTLMKQFLSRNRAVVMYGIFGVCTTLVNIVSYWLCAHVFGFLDWLIMFAAVTKLGFADMPVKIFSNVLVIILNYILGKFVVFRKRGS